MSDTFHHLDSIRTLGMPEHARDHLLNEILPFWFPSAIDRKHGGYFTCFNNRGQFVSDAKYTWSQGRFIAVCSSLADAADQGLLPLDADQMRTDARRGAEFLRDHALLPNYTTHYALDRTGRVLLGDPTPSLYADCFAAMGFAALARTTGEADWYELAARVVSVAQATAALPNVPTAPYQMPSGTRAYGVSMILLNVELEMAASRAALGLPEDAGNLSRAVDSVRAFARPDGTFNEVLNSDLDHESLLARHRTPGHGLEGIWMMALARGREDTGLLTELGEQTLALCELGWDDEFGGILRYTDGGGGQPRGTLVGIPYEELVAKTWDTKLWWVHSEAAWTTALMASLTGDGRLMEWRDRIWEYTRTTFPGRGQGAEWIQIRDRAGEPLDQVVALPLKDPYHLIRNLLQIAALDQTVPPTTARKTTEGTQE